MRKFYSILIVLLLMICMPYAGMSQIKVIEDTETGLSLYFTGVSGNGKYVSGYLEQSVAATIWTEDSGLTIVTAEAGGAKGDVISDNGILAGQFADPNVLYDDPWDEMGPYAILSAGYYKDGAWTGFGILTDTPADSYSGSMAEGISDDGSIIAGSMYLPSGCLQPTIWRNDVPEALEFEDVGQGARIQGLSANGRIAAGWRSPNYERLPVIWIDGVLKPITNKGVEVGGECAKVSPNGRYVALTISNQAALYNVETDELILIGRDARAMSSTATAVSDDGFVVGYSGGLPWDPRYPFIFSEKTGMMDLNQYLNQAGVEGALDADLSTPMGITADGLRIVGFSSLLDKLNGWVADLDHHLEGFYPPSNLAIEEVATGHLKIQWTAPKADEDNTLIGYHIYRNGTKIASLDKNMLMFEEIGLPNGTYTYYVTAIWNEADESRPTNEVTMNTAKVGFPFSDNFSSLSLNTNYWNITQGSESRWKIDEYMGIEAPSAGYYSPAGTFSEYMVSPVIDASAVESLFLSYNISVPTTWGDPSTDKFRLELYDGESWQTVKEYVPHVGDYYPFVFEKIDITSEAAGKEIRFRFTAEGNASGDNLIWALDNIYLFDAGSEFVKEIPVRFTAHKMSDGTVRLNWADPGNYATLGYLEFESTLDWISNEGAPLIAAIKYEPEDLLSYNGFTMKSVSAFLTHVLEIAEEPVYNIVLFEGAERVYEQLIASPVLNVWSEYTLDTPYFIKTSYDAPLYIGIEVVSADPTDMPIGLGDRYNIDGYKFDGRSNLFSEDGGTTWQNLFEVSEGMIAGGVGVKGNLIKGDNPHTTDRLIGFMVYEEGRHLLVSEWDTNLYYTKLHNYTVSSPSNESATCYQVTAFYDSQENSEPAEFCLGDEVVSIGCIAGNNDLYSIYPNPVENTLNISGEFTSITLTSLNGATILKSAENKINVGSLPSGVYILKIESAGNAPVVKKIIKQ